MTHAEKILARQRRLNAITASAPTGTPIAANWDAEFSITAATPNPAANLDVPDGTDDKTAPKTGVESAPNGKKQRDAKGNPPTARFNITAYNGGPMKLNGYKFPVIVDGTGIKAASPNLPIYVGHCQSWESPANQMEQLIGQTDGFTVNQSTGEIDACGPITGESEMCKSAMAHAKNGFKFQASINAQPSKIDFIPEGVEAKVNGRPVTGPCVVARAVTCDHIALVPLGADTSTTAKIAAEAAKGIAMELNAWIVATYGIDPATLTAAQKTKFEAEFAKISASPAAPAPAPVAAAAAPVITATADNESAIKAYRAMQAAEDKRLADVRKAAKDFPEIAAQAVSEGWTLDKTEVAVMRAERTAEKGTAPAGIVASATMPKDGLQMIEMPPQRGGRQIATGGGRIGNDHAAIIEAAGLISAGYSADALTKNPAYGVRVVEMADKAMARFGKGLGPMGLMRLTAAFAGLNLPHNAEDAYKALTAEFSTLSLPVILSNLMNKFLLDSYTAVDPDFCAPAGSSQVAWQQFTKRGPVQDFKPHYRVRLAGNLEFQTLGQSGEIQSGKVGEQSYQLQADTKAIMFALTRKDIINDDLSAMSTIPTLFGRGAGISVAKLIYGLLILALQSDRSTAFFTSSAVTTAGALMQPNLITTSALSMLTLEAAEAAFMAQTDPYGLPFGGVPEILLVPPGVKNLAMQLYQSQYLIPSITTTGAAATAGRGVPQANTLAGRFKPVCSNWLAALTAAQVIAATGVSTANSGSNSTWYLCAGSQQPCYPIEAGFLNGSEMPIVERDEMHFDRLGIAFRGFLDFGANLAEQRSIVKATA